MQHHLVKGLMALFAISGISTATLATPVIDGNVDVEYGAAKSSVGYDPNAPRDNFGSPTNKSQGVSYNVYLEAQPGYVYGVVKSTFLGTSQGTFSNLYFDLNPGSGYTGTEIVCEITNNRCGVAGGTGYAPVSIQQFVSANSIEFALPNSVFTAPLPGLESQYPGNFPFPTAGMDVVLGLSQTFSDSANGGATYGNDLLGRVTLMAAAAPAVPEPASWALMIVGFGITGCTLRRRKASKTPAYA